jgi:hypothetical protein
MLKEEIGGRRVALFFGGTHTANLAASSACAWS